MINSRGSKYNQEHYNLIVSAHEGFWENGVASFPRDRFLETTYGNRFEVNEPTLHHDYLKELMNYPCLFAYEKGTVQRYNLEHMAYIGRITKFVLGANSITLNFEIDSPFSMGDILNLERSLDVSMSGYSELNRTHWAVKNINFYDILDSHSHLLENQDVNTRPKAFFSYSWDSQITEEIVQSLYESLTTHGVHVVYDKQDLKPGNSMFYFMEKIHREKFNKIYLFCDESYIEKSNSMKKGVGIESTLLRSLVYENPEQSKVVPIFVEGAFKSPNFATGVIGLPLRRDHWEKDVDNILGNLFK